MFLVLHIRCLSGEVSLNHCNCQINQVDVFHVNFIECDIHPLYATSVVSVIK